MMAQFPERPKLRAYYHVVPLADDRLLFQGGGNTVVLRGESVRDLLPLLLPLFDGTRTMPEIADALPDVAPEVVAGAIALFHEKQLLEDAAAIPPAVLAPYPDRLRPQAAFWLSLGDDRYARQQRLATARVAILGIDAVGTALAQSLAAAGVGNLLLVNTGAAAGRCAPRVDIDAGHDTGEDHGEALSSRLSALYGDVRCVAAASSATTPEEMTDLLDGCDMAVFCADAPAIAGIEALNEACLHLHIPWTRGCLDHHRGVIGPTVIPRETACFTCFTLRVRSNAAFVDDAIAFERHIRETGDGAAEPAFLAPLASMVAQHVALETLKVLTGFAYPRTAGALLALDALTGETTRHDVLKLPRCPTCGPLRDRPQMKIWDITTAAT